MKATQEALERLHNSIADGYTRELKKYADGAYVDKDGNPEATPAALLAGAARFLKDNRIDSPEFSEPDPDDLLNDELPEFEP